jgi:hypothetical protein
LRQSYNSDLLIDDVSIFESKPIKIVKILKIDGRK